MPQITSLIWMQPGLLVLSILELVFIVSPAVVTISEIQLIQMPQYHALDSSCIPLFERLEECIQAIYSPKRENFGSFVPMSPLGGEELNSIYTFNGWESTVLGEESQYYAGHT